MLKSLWKVNCGKPKGLKFSKMPKSKGFISAFCPLCVLQNSWSASNAKIFYKSPETTPHCLSESVVRTVQYSFISGIIHNVHNTYLYLCICTHTRTCASIDRCFLGWCHRQTWKSIFALRTRVQSNTEWRALDAMSFSRKAPAFQPPTESYFSSVIGASLCRWKPQSKMPDAVMKNVFSFQPVNTVCSMKDANSSGM